MKLNKIITNVKTLAGSDGEELTSSQYKFIIDYYRSKLVKQQIDKGRNLAPVFIQILTKIEVEEIGDTDPGCVVEDCDIYKTTNIIPSIIPYNFTSTLPFVGSTDGYLPFQETAFQALNFEMYAKYIKNQPKWFILGDKLYVINPPDEAIEYIAIHGVFDDPIAAMATSSTFDETCLRNYNVEYPISGAMLDTIYKLIKASELNILLQELDEDEAIAR